ncbi:C-type lectin domain family 10 member A-like [Sesbania bispinosa]|nr:C-type lectin domain family 10 member A-like [Sesbania bispinosa]
MAARTTFLAHSLSHGVTTLEKEKANLKKKNEILQQKLRLLNNSEEITRDLTQKVVGLEVEEAKVPNLSKEVEALSSRLKTLETEHQKTVEKKE